MSASHAAHPEPRSRPLRRILVPTDFSRDADAALERAALLPLAPDATLHVVHVLPANLTRKTSEQTEPGARRLLEESAALASAAVHRAGHGEINIVPLLVRGQEHVEIIRQARAREAELIALGRHGPHPLRDRFLGSTAERVIRMGDLPVLVVNTRPAGPYRCPIVGLDLADTAGRVVRLALRLLDPEASRCWLVHAYHLPFEHWMTEADREEWRDRTAAKLRGVVAKLDAPDVRLETVLRTGRPESALIEEAVRLQGDLIALGTHARSGLAHVLLGSVAAQVLRNASCDVVVARPARFTFEMP
jgi:nucleotide-binding universal stress UspA family protein